MVRLPNPLLPDHVDGCACHDSGIRRVSPAALSRAFCVLINGTPVARELRQGETGRKELMVIRDQGVAADANRDILLVSFLD